MEAWSKNLAEVKINYFYCSPSSTASSSCFIIEAISKTLVNPCWLFPVIIISLQMMYWCLLSTPFPKVLSISYRYVEATCPHSLSLKLAVQRLLQEKLLLLYTLWTKLVHLNHTKLCCTPFATAFNFSHNKECVCICTYVYACIYRGIYKDKAVIFQRKLSEFSIDSYSF